MEKCSTKHLEEFLDLLVNWRFIFLLQEHIRIWLPVLYFAFEQDTPIKVTGLASSLKSDYENTLKNGGLTVDPLQLNAGE